MRSSMAGVGSSTILAEARTNHSRGCDVTQLRRRSRTSTRMYLVFDIGGTTVRGGLYDPDRGHLMRTHRAVTPSTWSERTATAADLHDQLVRLIAEAANA